MNLKSRHKILIAFILNLGFSIYEFFGGLWTHSIAITSDAIHDFGDALSIGLAYLLERKSLQPADENYTYGYRRYSLLGGLLTTTILIVGSVFVITHAFQRFFQPADINYDGMILLAIIGTIVNFLAAYFTHGGHSLNQKSVNLHMLEDVLGWIVVLIGAIVMRFTGFSLIDPILSILVALFILKEALANARKIFAILLEKTPHEIHLPDLQKQLSQIPDVQDVHHLHIWSMDGTHNYATLHAVLTHRTAKLPRTKSEIRQLCKTFHIDHVTIEVEFPQETCSDLGPTLTAKPQHHKNR